MKIAMVGIAMFTLAAISGAAAQQAEPEPLFQAFAANFDADVPITLSGKIIRSEWLEPKSVIWVQGSPDGGADRMWRVDTGAASLFADADRRALAEGVQVRIRGYNAKDTTCATTCRMAGRDFTLPNGLKIMAAVGQGVCSTDELIRETCAVASRPGPPPTLP